MSGIGVRQACQQELIRPKSEKSIDHLEAHGNLSLQHTLEAAVQSALCAGRVTLKIQQVSL